MSGRRLNVWLDGYREEEWRGIKIEYPLYIQCYEEALEAIMQTIEYNAKGREAGKEDFNCSLKEPVFAGAENEYTECLEKSNIIAFIGDRGGGKTTALGEFCRILHEYPKHFEDWEEKFVYRDLKKYCFHILAPIDASVLGAKEDVMEVILARMYQAFRNEMEGCRKPIGNDDLVQTIIREFDEVYRDYINVGKRENKELMSESVLAKLKYISNSLKARTSLKQLISHFLELLDRRKRKESYFVIVIDDLDMNLENGYAMLDQIQKYLSNPRVILLIAIKYEQMKMICNQHFADCITPKYGGIHEGVYDHYYDNARELSSDYLLKVLPISNRIYMPDESLLDKKGVVVLPDNPAIKYTVKEFVLTKIADKMNIYYDAVGMKRHFCLPHTIRELAFYDQFLDSLYSVKYIECTEAIGKERQMLLYDQNHERFNADIEYKMAMRILDDNQLKLYRQIMNISVERRTQYTVSFLDSWMERKTRGVEEAPKKDRSRLKDIVDGLPYRYSDLLRILYVLGRENHKDKALVHCLLASFTTEMVREYYSYNNSGDREEKNRSAVRLKKILGDAFGGKWFQDCMPKITGELKAVEKGKKVKIEIGYIPDVKMEELQIELNTNVSDTYEKACWMARTLVSLLPCVERLLFLFSNFRDEQGKSVKPNWTFEIIGKNTDDDKFSLTLFLNSHTEKADFDMFGFIGKEICETDEKGQRIDDISFFGEQIREDFMKAYQDLYKMIYKDSEKRDVQTDAFKACLCSHSIWNETEREHHDITFPFYNLDMSYNIMKRMRKSIKENIKLKEKNVYEYYSTVYGYIADELDGEDKKYREWKSGECRPHFLKDFLESPYMRGFHVRDYMSGRQKDREAMENFLQEIINIIGQEVFELDIDAQGI